MLYFLTSGTNTKQLEAYTLPSLRAEMIDELGWYITDLSTDELIDEINAEYECSEWSFVAWNKKDAVEVLRDWGITEDEIKELFKDIIKNRFK